MMILRFRKSHYGLKQSLDIWYGTFKDVVISFGLGALCVDGVLFVHHHNKDHGIVESTVILYIYDLLIIANVGSIWQITYFMKKRFQMDNLGSVSFYLGLNMENWKHHTINLHQQRYNPTILAMFRMVQFRQVTTPMAIKLQKGSSAKKPTIRPYTN
jgi:hypothetical protein